MRRMQQLFDRDTFMDEPSRVYNKEIMKFLWKGRASYRRVINEAKRNEAKLEKVCITFSRHGADPESLVRGSKYLDFLLYSSYFTEGREVCINILSGSP